MFDSREAYQYLCYKIKGLRSSVAPFLFALKMPLSPSGEIRGYLEQQGMNASWTVAAAAAEYRETLELERQFSDNPAQVELPSPASLFLARCHVDERQVGMPSTCDAGNEYSGTKPRQRPSITSTPQPGKAKGAVIGPS